MSGLLVTLLLRLIAFALVNYGLTSVDLAVSLTSDPTIVNELNLVAAGLVVMLTEDLSRKIGVGPTKVIMGIMPGFIKRLIARFTIPKAK